MNKTVKQQNGWREVKLGNFATVKGGKRLPKGKLLSKTISKHPYIRITDFDGHRINLSNIEFVDEQTQSLMVECHMKSVHLFFDL